MIQENQSRTLACGTSTLPQSSVPPAVDSAQTKVDPNAMHCGITRYVQWIRSLNEPPTPQVKAAKLQEIDNQCGSNLHLSNVQTSYDSALDRSHSSNQALSVAAASAATAVRVETSSPKSSPSKPASPSKPVDEFPVPPEKQLPTLKGIPRSGSFAVEVGESYGHQDTSPMTFRSEVLLFDLTNHKQYRWDLPRSLIEGLSPTGTINHRAGWAPKTSELLFAKEGEAFLVTRDGQARPLPLLMPGHLKPFDGIETYALSFDGQSLAYYIYTRDIGELQPDGFGKLYVDLMVENIGGSAPASIARDDRPSAVAWSPDGQKIAYADYEGQIVVLTRSGQNLITAHASPKELAPGIGPYVADLKWRPDGKQLGIIVANQLYVMDERGTQTRIVLKSPGLFSSDMPVNSFAWSPDGRRVVFRSSYGAAEKCNYGALGYKFNTGHFPCIHGTNLFVSDADGSNVAQITEQPDYAYASQGELFWVQ